CARPGLRIHEYLYFQVLSPGDIRYIFTATPAKDFGGVFVSIKHRICHEFVTWGGQEPALGSTGDMEDWRRRHLPLAHGVRERFGWCPGGWFLLPSVLRSPNSSRSHPSRYMIRRSLEQHGLPWAVISIPVNVTSIPTYEMMQPPWTFW
ncbi:PADC1 protein, partial [Halcyon senegalensis]|nr:PADC1 protein [Halcyon senegalensis]